MERKRRQVPLVREEVIGDLRGVREGEELLRGEVGEDRKRRIRREER